MYQSIVSGQYDAFMKKKQKESNYSDDERDVEHGRSQAQAQQ